MTSWIVFVAFEPVLCAREQPNSSKGLLATSLIVDGRRIDMLTTHLPRQIRVQRDGEKEFMLFKLPGDTGEITEFRASRWTSPGDQLLTPRTPGRDLHPEPRE